jgi:bifunctional UDP-N-acetylglucosamine pyrophosphorylase/glucosamine-1-phosphate N-acetyltransferase
MTEPIARPKPTEEALLSQLRARLQRAAELAAAGVTVVDTATTYIDDGVTIGAGTVIEPNTTISGRSAIGRECRIGPFGHVRGNSEIGPEVHLGHSVEVNRSRIGRGTKAAHFCYIADADVGENVNFGAGTVTCNYDGEGKHPTVIGNGAFIGSDTMLVAPVKIGRGAGTAAGSVVTKDVADGKRVAGVPAREMSERDG